MQLKIRDLHVDSQNSRAMLSDSKLSEAVSICEIYSPVDTVALKARVSQPFRKRARDRLRGIVSERARVGRKCVDR